ncbi:MAG: cytochrome b N-terminal domain-containing protein [Deltaproteobacteria bacterium]|nr:cytochrome b N-terminal domain-containing protein [Deltaproteobacteria bacterium]
MGSAPESTWRRLVRGLDERTGLIAGIRSFADSPVPGGARWRYVFGSALLSSFVTQIVTGVFLAFHFSPTLNDAWGSIVYLEEKVALGRELRALHHWGANVMVGVMILHFAQVVLAGAYKRPRELNWIIGLAAGGLVLMLALTGYLLPLDERGYYATQVALNITASVPGVGPSAVSILQGGARFGVESMSRFYTLHAMVLPGALALLVVLHVVFVHRLKVTAPFSAAATNEPFWPRQAFRDALAMSAAFALTVVLALAVGTPLLAPADPARAFDARPEWYFLPLFELLKLLEGDLLLVGTVVLPGVAALALVLLPWLDRAPTVATRSRLRVIIPVFFGLAIAASLGAKAALDDANSPEYQRRMSDAHRAAERARALAKQGGIPPSGPTHLYENDPVAHGERLFLRHCRDCHAIAGDGGRSAPDLAGYRSPKWYREFFRDPNTTKYYGHEESVSKGAMKSIEKLGDEKLVALAAFFARGAEMRGVDEGTAKRGETVWKGESCMELCHTFSGAANPSGNVPDLKGHGSRGWLRGFLVAPGDARFFGKRNRMPSFRDKLSSAERDAVIEFVATLHEK